MPLSRGRARCVGDGVNEIASKEHKWFASPRVIHSAHQALAHYTGVAAAAAKCCFKQLLHSQLANQSLLAFSPLSCALPTSPHHRSQALAEQPINRASCG